MQPLRTKEITQPLRTKNIATSWDQKKSLNILKQKNLATAQDKKITQPLRQIKSHNLSHKKCMQPLATKKIAQPLGTKKSRNPFGQKNHALNISNYVQISQ